jgi:hypothetical protein
MMRRLLNRARPLLPGAIILFAYLALRTAFDALTLDDGLLTPGGRPKLGVAAFGLLVLALRLVVLFVLPAWAVFRFASRDRP